MQERKVVEHTAHPTAALRGLLLGLTVLAILAADPAMARRGKGGMPPGIQLVPVAQPARPAQPAAGQKEHLGKPIVHPGRHGSKPRGGSR